jgi:hypothetical protein
MIAQLFVFELRQGRGDLARGVFRIEHKARIGEGRHHRHRGRKHDAVAIDDVGALGLDGAAARSHTLGRLGAIAQQRHVAHAQCHREEGQREDCRSDDQPLAGGFLRVAL